MSEEETTSLLNSYLVFVILMVPLYVLFVFSTS